ncbi:SIS domain-containing protein [Neobacillus sp. 179-J 1A1 HS]|uniref:SIS domain-containing protein n=1 Tax=Neobacillus driksii TaxID=3035913 RepID=UPI0035BC31F6
MANTLLDCIFDQPQTMKKVIEMVPKEVEVILNKINGCFKKIYLVGSGTSLNAAKAAKSIMVDYLGSEIQVITPFDFNHYLSPKQLNSETLVIGISQTARSIATLTSIKRAREYGARTILVTAEKERPEANAAEFILDTWTGFEPVGPKSKGYTSTIASLYLFAAGLAKRELDLDPIPNFMEDILQRTRTKINDLIESFISVTSCVIISYGPNMATASEGALKISETLRIPVEVYEVEEYMHGPYHCLGEDSHIIFISPPGPGQARMKELIKFVQQYTEHTFIISNEDFIEEETTGITLLLPKEVNEILTPLGYIIPLQYLASEVTRKMGRQPEASRHPQFHASLGSKIPQKYY